MQAKDTRPAIPALKELVAEASQALARLDAGRLEELALSCHALNKDLPPTAIEKRRQFAQQAREAAGDMAVFARVLAVTRDNLEVMNRLREMHLGRVEYGERQLRGGAKVGNGYGNH
jgi:hypothetical protein